MSGLGIGRAVARNVGLRRAGGAVDLNLMAPKDARSTFIRRGDRPGLAVQTDGVLAQYLTKLDFEPDGFSSHYAKIMARHREPFQSLFLVQTGARPAILLRIGLPREHPARRSLRLPTSQLMRASQEASNGHAV